MFVVDIMVSLSPLLTRRDVLPFGQAPYDWLVHILGSAVPAFLVTAALHGSEGVPRPGGTVPALAGRGALVCVRAAGHAGRDVAVRDRGVWGRAADRAGRPVDACVHPGSAAAGRAVVFSNFAEEIGFAGFLFPRLQQRYGPLRASVVITVPFALWHVPGWLVETGSLAMALVLVGLFALPHLASRVIVGWLYNGTGRSVLLVGLFHAAHNATVGAFGFARTFIPGSDEATLVMASDIAPPRRC